MFLWVADDVEKAWDTLMSHIVSQIEEYNAFTVEGYGEAAGPYVSGVSPEEIGNDSAYQVLTPEETAVLGQRLGERGVFLLIPLMGVIEPDEAWQMWELFDSQAKPYLP